MKRDLVTLCQQCDAPSDALRRFIDEEMSSRLDTAKSLKDGDASAGKIADWWADFDACETAFERGAMATYVRQGLRLAQILAHSEGDFAAGLVARGLVRASAYKRLDLFLLFYRFGNNLDCLIRAAKLGAERISRLKPMLKLDGIHALIAHGETRDLHYDEAVQMSTRDIDAWRKRRRRRMAADAVARGRIKPQIAPAPEKEPPAATVAREEGVATLGRARAEIALLSSVIAKIPPQNDDVEKEAWFRAAAVAGGGELCELLRDIENLRHALVSRFGASYEQDALDYQPSREEEALWPRWIEEVHAAAEERTRERHQRHHWRGRPAIKRAHKAPSPRPSPRKRGEGEG